MEPLPLYRALAPAVAVALLAVLCAVKREPRLRAMLLGIAVLVGYAVLQDQVSARLCPEYFTVLHNPIPGLTDPTLLGVAWGFLGAWWGGALMGYAAGLCATVGPRPPMTVRQLVKPMLVLVAGVGVVTAIAGFSVWKHAQMMEVEISSVYSRRIPTARHQAAFVVACYHFVAYVAAVVGSVVLCVWIRTRRAAASPPAPPPP